MTSPNAGDSFLKCSRQGSMRFCKFSSRDFHQPDENETDAQTLDTLPHVPLKTGEMSKEKKESMSEEYQCGCKPQVIPFDKENNWQVLLVGKLHDNECFPILSRIIKILKERSCSFYVEGNSMEKMITQLKADSMEKEIGQIHHFESKKHELIIDLIITLGGDGTILYAMSHFQRRESPPIIALEKGTLGFMCMYQIDNIEKDFSKIQENIQINKNLMVERKMRIQAVVTDSKGKIAVQSNGERKEFHALNEIVVDRGQNASCLKMEIFLNNENLTKTLGDGLIFSTPTGSTAYSLSAGGPIIQNEVRSISLVPICPFSLSFRPIVLPPCSELRVKLSQDNRGQGKISGDGQKVFDFLPDEVLSIQSSDIDVLVVRETYKANNIHEWMLKLRKMLNWNSNFSK